MKQNAEERLYKTYVTDMLKHIVNNSAGGEKRLQVEARYSDLADNYSGKPKPEPKPEQTSQEIISRIRDKLSKL